jgi:hypothetical protein
VKLIFVYNAKAGLLHGLMDSLRKTLSPGTYECGLCAITHGFFTMDKGWRAYLKSLPHETDFYHKADFGAHFPEQERQALPLIGLDRDGALTVLLGPEAIKTCPDANSLAAALDAALQAEA